MGCKLRILRLDEIESRVSSCGGTWIKKRNLRKKLIAERNESINFVISQINEEIRRWKASAITEKDLRLLYSFKSKMEIML
jgi:hypothetical protein